MASASPGLCWPRPARDSPRLEGCPPFLPFGSEEMPLRRELRFLVGFQCEQGDWAWRPAGKPLEAEAEVVCGGGEAVQVGSCETRPGVAKIALRTPPGVCQGHKKGSSDVGNCAS